MRQISCITCICLFSNSSFASSTTSKGRLERILSTASFRPQLPSDKEIVLSYGVGKVTESYGERIRTYFFPDSKLWIQYRCNLDDKVYTPVSEILVSRIDLGSQRPIRGTFKQSLFGIKLGCKANIAERRFGRFTRTQSEKLGAGQTTVQEFFPKFLDDGIRIRVFIIQDRIVAMSIASTS